MVFLVDWLVDKNVRESFRRSGRGVAQTSIHFSFFPTSQPMSVKLFVGGIPYRMTVDELREVFSQAGEVTDVFIPMDRMTGRPRGFAFVEMADQEGADKAIAMFHDQEVGGRRVAVNIARPLEDRPPRAPRM